MRDSVLTGLNSNDWAASLRRDEHVNRRTALRRGEEHYGFIVFESCAMSVMVVTHTRRGWTFSERQISIYSTGIQLGHCVGDFSGVLPQIFLISNSVLINDEGHDAGIAVYGRIGNKGKSPEHLPIREVIFCAALRMPTLPVQDAEIVAVKRLM